MPSLRSFVVFVSTLVLLWGLSFAGQTPETLNNALIPFGLRLKIGDSLPVIRNFKFRAMDKTYHTIIAGNDTTRIEIGIIKPFPEADALVYARSQYIIIKSLYAPQRIPYTGQFTATTDCPPEKKPEELTADILGVSVTVLLVNATQRYVLGAWEDELIKQKAAFCVLYDPKTYTMYKVTVFRPSILFSREETLGILMGLKEIEAK